MTPSSTQWRVYITANNGNNSYTGLAELEMASEPGGANLCTGGTPIASSQHSTYHKGKAFDGNKNAYGWITQSGSEIPAYIGYTFSESVTIAEFRIWSDNPGLAGAGAELKDFVLQYHDGTDWVSVEDASYTGETGWGSYEQRTYAGFQPKSFYRVTGKVVTGENTPAIGRNVFAHNQDTFAIIGSGVTDQFGNFQVDATENATIMIRVVDPNGIYNTVVRENLIPVEIPLD